MFSTQQMNDFFNQAQTRATARARELEQEARKILETLGDRAQAEMKTQLGALGVELEKLGKKLQALAAEKATQAEPATQPKPETVQ